jgi:putative FmdB family regulatory protein
MPVYEYKCTSCGEVTDELRSMFVRDQDGTCPSCGGTTQYRISAPRSMLDPCDPGFPGNYDKWARDRDKKMKAA